MTLAVNLVRKDRSAKFMCCYWRNPWSDCHVTHTPKCNEPAKIRKNYCRLTILIVSLFPCADYELRHSLDVTLLAKWPVILQKASDNPQGWPNCGSLSFPKNYIFVLYFCFYCKV